MTENTVLLRVDEYNELRDFQKGINEGKFVSCSYNGGYVYYATENDVIKSLKGDIKALKKKITKEKNIFEVKEMSLWQFFRWRKKPVINI